MDERNMIDLNEASDVLGVLPETFMKFVVKEEIEFSAVGEDVFFDKVDVVEFREKRRKEQSDAFQELRKLDAENGIV